MKLQRFFCEQKLADKGEVVITHDALVNQLKNVFRLTKGDEIVLFDNSGYDFFASILGYEKDTVSLTIVKSNKSNIVPKQETYLFASLIKKDNFEWVLQKATELGVSHIVPILSRRTEKKDLNIERAQKIIIEASEQSGRATLPVLHDIVDLETALNEYSHIKSIAWHTIAPKFVSQEIDGVVGAYIGPEGGWSIEEQTMFEKHGVSVKSLGPQVLRSETAVIAVLSRLVF